MEDLFLSPLDGDAGPTFRNIELLSEILARLRDAALAAYPDVHIDAATFTAELARRLGVSISPEQLARVRADHVHLAIACVSGDPLAIRRFQDEFLGEVDATARRLRARPDQTDEVRSRVHRILFVSEPGRPAALHKYSGRGDLRSYVRVIVTHEFMPLINRERREIGGVVDAFLDLRSPASDPEFGYLRQRYHVEVDAAIRAALASLPEQPRALLRYSVVDGWTIDRIGALYGVHRATAARWIGAARQTLGDAIRSELAARLNIAAGEADSIVRLVQSRIDVSIERLLE